MKLLLMTLLLGVLTTYPNIRALLRRRKTTA
jgi:hypothetical protein